MAFRTSGNIVDQNADFISESLVVKLVAFLKYSFKNLSKRVDNFCFRCHCLGDK